MLSSMLLPNTQKKIALPSMWPHPPCRNIDVNGVKTLIGSVVDHARQAVARSAPEAERGAVR